MTSVPKQEQMEMEKNVLESEVGGLEGIYIDLEKRVSKLERVVSLINRKRLNLGDRLNLLTIAVLPLVQDVVIIDDDEEVPEPSNQLGSKRKLCSYADGSSSESDNGVDSK